MRGYLSGRMYWTSQPRKVGWYSGCVGAVFSANTILPFQRCCVFGGRTVACVTRRIAISVETTGGVLFREIEAKYRQVPRFPSVAADVGYARRVPNYPGPVINLDEHDGDWIKRGTWDIPARNGVELRAWLAASGIRVEQFKRLTV